MTDLDEALMRLRARMVIRNTEIKLRKCTEEERKTGLSIQAYYLGQAFSGSRINPFNDIDHPCKAELVSGFLTGVSTAHALEQAIKRNTQLNKKRQRSSV